MIRAIGIVFIFFFFPLLNFSQTVFNIAYGTTDSETTERGCLTSDGGFISCGQKMFPVAPNNFRGYLLRTDSVGNIVWAKNYVCGPSMYFVDIKQTPDGGFIVVGNILSGGVSKDILLLKTDSLGNVQWAHALGNPGASEAVRAVKLTSDGGYIVLAEINGGTFGNYDVYVVKTDFLGNVAWAKTFGSAGVDIGFSIEEIPGTGYVFTGLTTSYGTSQEIYVVKLNYTGNTLWSKTYGETGLDAGRCLTLMPDGSYLVVASTSNYAPSAINKINLLKIKSNGDTAWTKCYYNSASQSGCGYDIWNISPLANNHFLITSYFNTSPPNYFGHWLKVDSLGNSVWGKTFITGDAFYQVHESSTKGIIGVAATNWAGSGPGGNDAYLVKTDSAGSIPCIQTNDLPVKSPSKPKIQSVVISDANYPGFAIVSVTQFVDPSFKVAACITTNIVAYSQVQAELFPNPTAGNVTVICNEKTTLAVYNSLGQLIYSTNIKEQKTQIDLNKEPNGIYFIRIGTLTKKIIKQ
jgi:hypothetical protein